MSYGVSGGSKSGGSVKVDFIALGLIVIGISLFLFLGLSSPATMVISTYVIALTSAGITLMIATKQWTLTEKIGSRLFLTYFLLGLGAIFVFNFAIQAIPAGIAVPSGSQAKEVAINIAIAEEVWFRGFLLPFFARRIGYIPGILASAGFWALYHIYTGDPFSSIFLIFMIGIVFGFIAIKTGLLSITMAIHIMNNFLAVS